LNPRIVSQVTRSSGPGEDHLARLRIAGTLDLPAPAAPERPGPGSLRTLPPGHLMAARAGTRVLAAVGRLDLDTVSASIARSRRFRDRAPLSTNDLPEALTAVGAIPGLDGRWQAPPAVEVPDRYGAIVAAANGRDLSRAEMIYVLVEAGYSPSSATGRMSSSHPLFQRIGSNCYGLIGPSLER